LLQGGNTAQPPAHRADTEGEWAAVGIGDSAGAGRNGGGGCDQRRRAPVRRAAAATAAGLFTLAVINPTSAAAHVADLKALNVDVVMIAEPSLTKGAQKHVTAELAAGDRAYQAIWSAPQPPRIVPGAIQSVWDAVPGGTGALSRRPLPIQKAPTSLEGSDLVLPGEPDLFAEGRLLHTAIPVGSGRTVVHLLVYYGWSGARSGNAEAKHRNELGLRQALRYAAALGKVPVILAGDMNDEPASSPTLAEALQSGRWWDCALMEAQKQEPPVIPSPTYVTASGSSRIDLALLNGEAKAAFRRAWVGDPEAHAFPGHRPLFVEFQWSAIHQHFTRLRKPRPIPRLPQPKSEKERKERAQKRAELLSPLLSVATPLWEEALAQKDSNGAWRILSEVAELLFIQEAKEAGLVQKDISPQEEAKMRGRGEAAKFRKAELLPAAGPINLGEGPAHLRRLHNLKSRTRHLAAMARPGATPDPREYRHLWARVKKGTRELLGQEEWATAVTGRNPPSHEDCGKWADQVAAATAAAQRKQQKERIKSWEESVKLDWRQTGSSTFRWLRDDFHPKAAFMQLASGELTGAISEMREEAQREWTSKVYRDETRIPVQRQAVNEKYGPLLRTRAKQHLLTKLRAQDLADTLASWPRSKKGGTDAWEADLFRDLPSALLEWAAELLDIIEEGAPWPDSQVEGLVALVPKKATAGTALEQRPITLTNLLYRLWSGTRCRQSAEWLQGWAHPHMGGSPPEARTQCGDRSPSEQRQRGRAPSPWRDSAPTCGSTTTASTPRSPWISWSTSGSTDGWRPL
jgi:hypothetical protein